jgi:cobalt/nickel transport system permease protein
MHLEEFAEGTTLLHRLDPRVKFLAAGPLMMLIAVVPGIKAPALALVLACVLACMARLDTRKLALRLAAVNAFVLVLWVFLPLSYPGEAVFSVGTLHVTGEGVLYVLAITLKTNAIVLLTIAVFGTSEAFALAHALVHLKAPVKLVYLFFFFYRYISVLHEEYTRLRRAMNVRGFRPATTMHTYRTFGYLIGMLMVRSHERARRIFNAMLCRGFHGHFPIARHFHLHAHDIWFTSLMFLLTASIGWIAFHGGQPW